MSPKTVDLPLRHDQSDDEERGEKIIFHKHHNLSFIIANRNRGAAARSFPDVVRVMGAPYEQERNPHHDHKKTNHKQNGRWGRSEWRHVVLLNFLP